VSIPRRRLTSLGVGTASAMVVDRAGDTLALHGQDSSLSVWRRQTPSSGLDLRETDSNPMPIPDADGLSLSADGSTVLLREADGKLHIAPLGSDTMLVRPYMRPFPLDIRAVDAAIDSNGSTAFVALPNGDLEAVELNWVVTDRDPTIGKGGEPLPEAMTRDPQVTRTFILPGHGAMVDHIAASPDGAWLASASIDGRLRITNVERARQIAGLPLASLVAGPETAAIQPETLFDSPYAFLDETLVMKVQRGLQKAGYDVGPPDGILGAVTRTRISEYQEKASLPQTGDPDRALYAHMKAAGLFDAKAAAE
jgi:hypothetical protein